MSSKVLCHLSISFVRCREHVPNYSQKFNEFNKHRFDSTQILCSIIKTQMMQFKFIGRKNFMLMVRTSQNFCTIPSIPCCAAQHRYALDMHQALPIIYIKKQILKVICILKYKINGNLFETRLLENFS